MPITFSFGQGPEPTEAGLFDIFTDPATEAVEGATQSAILAFIEAEKEKAIAEAKRAVVPVVIGVGAVSGLATAALFWLFTRKT